MSFQEQLEQEAAEYLLGGLAESERSAIHSRLFEDDTYFALLLDVENDLMDAYAAGTLSRGDRIRVEKHLLSTSDQQQKLAVAMALQRRRSAVPRWIPAAAVALLLIATSLLLRDRWPSSARPPAAPQQVAALVLRPGELRGESRRPILTLPQSTGVVEVRLILDGPSGQGPISATVRSPRGQILWQQPNLKVETRNTVPQLAVWLPSNLLASGVHEIEIQSGGEPIAFYTFQVTR